jgi:Transposase DDE domain group 1
MSVQSPIIWGIPDKASADPSDHSHAKVEWHPGELYPRVGFIVTNMSRPAENVVAFYNKRGTCEQWIKEGKGAIKWTRLSCRSFTANAVRLQLHALAYNLGNFLRTLAAPERQKIGR